MKKVLFILIDALATRVVEPALKQGRLPHLAAVAEAGTLCPQCISVFPSITPAATCSLVTGCYPRQHGICGAYWYDAELNDVAYFGSDMWPILNEGLQRYIRDFQVELNFRRLQVPTIFQQIERHGHLRDAVINLFWFRGTVPHEVQLPLIPKLLAGRCGEHLLYGPHLMFMGDFVNTPIDRSGNAITARGGLLRRYGFHDETTADYLLGLARASSLPEFTLAYFPNNDFESHHHGPTQAVTSLEYVDQQLGELFDLYGGLTAMLEHFAILITGDHSQSDIDSPETAAIDLQEALHQFQLVEAGGTWQSDDEIMVCPNLRAAQVYLQSGSWRHRQTVIESLLTCDGIDQVIWCDTAEGPEESASLTYHVATRERGTLHFRTAESTLEAMGRDHFGGVWRWEGDLRAVDLQLRETGVLECRDYPNPLERIANSFHRQSGDLWITARLGREFRLPSTSCSARGSHGSLHAFDSTSPLFAAGLPDWITVARRIRSVDIMPLCLRLLDLDVGS